MRTGGLLSLGLGFLNRIPILWTVVVVIALIGAIYYLIVGRTKAFAPVRALSRTTNCSRPPIPEARRRHDG